MDMHIPAYYLLSSYKRGGLLYDIFSTLFHLLQVSLDEEKIWEQIYTIRITVGYKAAPNSSCVEELKALYVFTGVEPPSSLKGSDDLVTIDERLHFLMSIIGVKHSSS